MSDHAKELDAARKQIDKLLAAKHKAEREHFNTLHDFNGMIGMINDMAGAMGIAKEVAACGSRKEAAKMVLLHAMTWVCTKYKRPCVCPATGCGWTGDAIPKSDRCPKCHTWVEEAPKETRDGS